MRAVIMEAHGPPQVMRVVELATPEPGDDQVLVQVEAAGVNFVDLLQRNGSYAVKFPFAPGFEGSGVVLRAGAGVRDISEGDRVAWTGSSGSYASHCLVPARCVVPVPDALSHEQAAAALTQGMTAHFLASDVVPLSSGGSCLVHAAAGGVGGLLCQLTARRGAIVIGTVSNPAKIKATLDAGAHYAIDYSGGDIARRVMALTGGRGVDVVYDAIGHDTFAEGLACLRPRGTLVLYGQASGPVGPVDPQVLNEKGSLFLTKVSLRHYDATQAQLLHRARTVQQMVLDGTLRLRVHDIYALDDAPVAHEALESRRAVGKILLRP